MVSPRNSCHQKIKRSSKLWRCSGFSHFNGKLLDEASRGSFARAGSPLWLGEAACGDGKKGRGPGSIVAWECPRRHSSSGKSLSHSIWLEKISGSASPSDARAREKFW